MAALESGADDTDCKTWGIDDDQWQEAVKPALYAQWYDNLYEDLINAENDWHEAESRFNIL